MSERKQHQPDWSDLRKKSEAEARKKEKCLPSPVRGRVFYRATQVEYCLHCFGIEIKQGLRLAMLYPVSEFFLLAPEPRFFVGTVTKISGNPDDPLMEITWDGGPGGSLSWSGGVKQNSQFCIPLPEGYDEVPPAKVAKNKSSNKKANKKAKP
jgi:hypothetical protein